MRPAAAAVIRGSSAYPGVGGSVVLYPVGGAALVKAQLWGLPITGGEIFGFHIHEGGICAPDSFSADAVGGETFKKYARGHYDKRGAAHPLHSGDMPPLFGCRGTAYSIFLTDRFSVGDVIGKTVVIHLRPDDFTSQPSGNSGEMIACGVIRR